MPRCPNEPKQNMYKSGHIMEPFRVLPNGLVWKCKVCGATKAVIG